MVHTHLYAKKHTGFNDCCLDVMDFDDNFEVSSVSSLEVKEPGEKSGLDSNITTLMEFNVEYIGMHSFEEYETSVSYLRRPTPFASYTSITTWKQWIHRESIRPMMGTWPQTLDTRPFNYVAINSFERRMDPSSLSPYQRERDPSLMEPYYDNQTNLLSQNYSRSVQTSMFVANQ